MVDILRLHSGVAYRLIEGAGPVVIFLPGYGSDMCGTKASALADWAESGGQAYLRFDYRGCGESEGVFEEQSFADWRDDVVAAIDLVAPRPAILVGSSLGGWLMLPAAKARSEQVVGLVGVAPAPDFTDWGFTIDEKIELLQSGRIERASPYGPEPTIYTKAFWSSGEANRLMFGPVDFDGPVRLLQGMNDAEVPWNRTIRLSELIRSTDVHVSLIKDGDHRLSRDADLALLMRTLQDLIEAVRS